VSTPQSRDRALEQLLRRPIPAASAVTPACADSETLAAWIDGGRGLHMAGREGERVLWISGALDSEHAEEVEAAVWDRMHFASHLRSERLGEFTVGTELHRSQSLAIVQVLVLYHLVTGHATVALGGDGPRLVAGSHA